MILPNRHKAYIPKQKLTAYLLSETHAVGKSKAKFFRNSGFDDTNTNLLEQELLKIAKTEVVKHIVSSPHGTKYVIEGYIETPKGKSVLIITVWIIENDEDIPRFITAYPA